MASNNSSARMEEEHFRSTNKTDKIGFNNTKAKNATKDFLNTETGKHNSIGNSIKTESPTKEDDDLASSTSENGLNNRKESIGSGLESDIEDNDSDANPSATSTELPVIKEPDPDIDENLPSTVTLLKTPDGGKCYLVGTAHFSIESQNDVSKVIQAVQPHTVVVELCLDRIHVLQLDEETILKEAQNLNFTKMMDTIKQNGVYKGLFYLLLLNMSANLTKALGLAPGGEFRRAVTEVKKVANCVIHLGDRPIKITFARALSCLSYWQTLKLARDLLLEKEPMTQKEVEKYKCPDSLEETMAELAGKYPALGEVFVKERDLYLTHSLQLACKPKIGMDGKPIPARVVGIVGIGHTIGIIENWGKVTKAQIIPIMSIPPPSLSSKVLKLTLKASVIGAVIYIGYKFIPIPTGMIQSIKSSVEGLIKVSASQ